MYKTVTLWLESNKGKKLEFNFGDLGSDHLWLTVSDGSATGDLSIQCNLLGLTQFVEGLTIIKNKLDKKRGENL